MCVEFSLQGARPRVSVSSSESWGDDLTLRNHIRKFSIYLNFLCSSGFFFKRGAFLFLFFCSCGWGLLTCLGFFLGFFLLLFLFGFFRLQFGFWFFLVLGIQAFIFCFCFWGFLSFLFFIALLCLFVCFLSCFVFCFLFLEGVLLFLYFFFFGGLS